MSTWDPDEPVPRPAGPTDELDLGYYQSPWDGEPANQPADKYRVGAKWLARQRERERSLRHQGGFDDVRLEVFDLGLDED